MKNEQVFDEELRKIVFDVKQRIDGIFANEDQSKQPIETANPSGDSRGNIQHELVDHDGRVYQSNRNQNNRHDFLPTNIIYPDDVNAASINPNDGQLTGAAE